MKELDLNAEACCIASAFQTRCVDALGEISGDMSRCLGSIVWASLWGQGC
ncbi:hypothetical protein RSSM_05632 [Rhodopirellula sallentina SM41]|uniref:Uncharacterized protein n=1 Tax=Rhodopirellula sallentina SM41 TaxID=1263870 RepID=M5TUR4_9BACT|nr:hypothetical protein RSSM_05632 [Rhodopirellula sallentina SM41]